MAAEMVDPIEIPYRRLSGNKGKKVKKGKWRFMTNEDDQEEQNGDQDVRAMLVRMTTQISPG